MKRIDVKGLSCPQPVFETKKLLDEMGKGTLEVLADSGTACDNIVRMAKKYGWKTKTSDVNGDNLITITK